MKVKFTISDELFNNIKEETVELNGRLTHREVSNELEEWLYENFNISYEVIGENNES